MGDTDEKDLDEEGLIKDEGRWDYKSTLEKIEKQIRLQIKKPIFNFDAEISEYINRSFLEKPSNNFKASRDKDGGVTSPLKGLKAGSILNDE